MIDIDAFKKTWQMAGEPYWAVLESAKVPQIKMSVVEMVFATCLQKAIEAAHRKDIKDPVGLASFVTGYLASMRMMPEDKGSATDSTQQPAAQNAAENNNGLGGTSGEPATKKDNSQVAGA